MNRQKAPSISENRAIVPATTPITYTQTSAWCIPLPVICFFKFLSAWRSVFQSVSNKLQDFWGFSCFIIQANEIEDTHKVPLANQTSTIERGDLSFSPAILICSHRFQSSGMSPKIEIHGWSRIRLAVTKYLSLNRGKYIFDPLVNSAGQKVV